jgi:hypothetical protein
MRYGIAALGLFFVILLFAGCQYRKGKSFTWSETGDSINYIIVASGKGHHMADKMNRLARMHEKKGDSCRIIYLSGQDNPENKKTIILFNSVLPNLKDDMLSKGFIGSFSTHQNITYLVVREDEFDKYLSPAHE